ncbi:serine/threonine-protein phosphatase [Actinacidiphila glaucinigra]|uniref:PP2C family protein-serine/threonine phosphatase n=1 Tax=Actinacidiphila glaucinigra TaxID=235986 RepID=UPI003248EFB2
MPELHKRLLADVITLGPPYPLVLTGGYAVRAHRLVNRPSQDLDVARARSPWPTSRPRFVPAWKRAIAACEPDPATVLTRTSDLLVTMDAARFASCTMLYIDPCDGQVTGSSAGHVPLLYVWDDGRHRIRELPGGPVLGVLADANYRGGSFRLDKNAALIMVTDGVVEGPSLPLEAGLERVATLAAQAAHDGLNTEETADRILDAMVAVDHIDDAAVLIIRRA